MGTSVSPWLVAAMGLHGGGGGAGTRGDGDGATGTSTDAGGHAWEADVINRHLHDLEVMHEAGTRNLNPKP
jgi:hypothetical protein